MIPTAKCIPVISSGLYSSGGLKLSRWDVIGISDFTPSVGGLGRHTYPSSIDLQEQGNRLASR